MLLSIPPPIIFSKASQKKCPVPLLRPSIGEWFFRNKRRRQEWVRFINLPLNIQDHFPFGAILAFTAACLTILAFTVRVHVRKNRVARQMAALSPVFERLVESIKGGVAVDDEIVSQLPPRNFPCFRRFLEETISTTEDIDTSAEKEMADLSGFTAHLKERIRKSRGWEKALAVRVLSYFRDPQHIPLFRQVLEEETFPQAIYAAAMGLALCKDVASAKLISSKTWEASKANEEALLTVLGLFGKAVAPAVHDALRNGRVPNDRKPAALMLLRDLDYKAAAPTISAITEAETDGQLIGICLKSLASLASESELPSLLPFLTHEQFAVRVDAIQAISEVGGESYLSQIEECLDDSNWWVRRAAAQAISQMGSSGITRLEAIGKQNRAASGVAARNMLFELQFNRITT